MPQDRQQEFVEGIKSSTEKYAKNDHEWFVIVKLKMPDDQYLGQTELEWAAQDVADSVQPGESYTSTHVVFDNGFGHYVRPSWAQDHEVGP